MTQTVPDALTIEHAAWLNRYDAAVCALAGCVDLDVAAKYAAELVTNSLGAHRVPNRRTAEQILAVLLHAAALDGTTIVHVATWVTRPTANVQFIARGLVKSPQRADAANKIAVWLGSVGPRFSASKFMIYMALRTAIDQLDREGDAS